MPVMMYTYAIPQIPFYPNPSLGETIASLQAETSDLGELHARMQQEYPEITFNNICNEILTRSVSANAAANAAAAAASMSVVYHDPQSKESTDIFTGLDLLGEAEDNGEEIIGEWRIRCCRSCCADSQKSISTLWLDNDNDEDYGYHHHQYHSATRSQSGCSSPLLFPSPHEQVAQAQAECCCSYADDEDQDAQRRRVQVECWLHECGLESDSGSDTESDAESQVSEASLLVYVDELGYMDLGFLSDDE